MILFFSDDTAFGSNITERLRNQGIPAVSHDPDFAKSICEQLDFCGVILDGRQDPKRFEVLSESLFESYRELPIAFLVTEPIKVFPCASRLIRASEDQTRFSELLDFCRQCMGSSDYSTFALQYNENAEKFTYLGYPLPLSDYERRFVLCLFRHAPNAVSTDVLLSSAFPKSRTPQNTLCTLAKRINQASKAISGLRLVQSVYGKGYRLCDGIVKRPEVQTAAPKNTHK